MAALAATASSTPNNCRPSAPRSTRPSSPATQSSTRSTEPRRPGRLVRAGERSSPWRRFRAGFLAGGYCAAHSAAGERRPRRTWLELRLPPSAIFHSRGCLSHHHAHRRWSSSSAASPRCAASALNLLRDGYTPSSATTEPGRPRSCASLAGLAQPTRGSISILGTTDLRRCAMNWVTWRILRCSMTK